MDAFAKSWNGGSDLSGTLRLPNLHPQVALHRAKLGYRLHRRAGVLYATWGTRVGAAPTIHAGPTAELIRQPPACCRGESTISCPIKRSYYAN